MHQVREEKSKMSIEEVNKNITEDNKKEATESNSITTRGNGFFIQTSICIIMIIAVLFLKYMEPNTMFEEQIKKELTQAVEIEDVKQFIYELEEMSDKYWRIK